MFPRLALLCILSVSQSAQSNQDIEITAEPHHHLALQNAYVRVFKVEVPPNDSTLMHRHRHDYLFVIIGPTEVENDVAGRPPVTIKLQDGEVQFTPGGFAHVARNLALTPFRNVTVELMGKAGPAKWDEDRGLQVLQNGTQHVLFVKDGARVSDIELQPAGVLPRHTHSGPHLVIAVTDLALRNATAGKKAANVALKAGDVQWVPAGATHTVTNVGPGKARWIAVEFH
jgi:quercetin dioxygenase-like cupin family protein